ncbi:MAG: beta-ketoacyl-ACP synthase II [Candidatus Brocadiae bacterium]|nr:beta-ketoacyl-ACP synthase II [Candidatus Brocadiia bacterium]
MIGKRRVVITGLGAVTSLGVEVEEIWKNLLAQKSGISNITRFDASAYSAQIAGEIKNFDPSCSISKKDIYRLDLFSQYALCAADKAIQDTQFSLEKEDLTRFGVILGCGMGGMNEIEAQSDVMKQKGPKRVSAFSVPRLMINAISAEISIKYGLLGPNFITASACSSSAQAIGQALRSIQYNEADVVVTGGAEAVITPLSIAGFCSARALSQRNQEPQRASRPFDKERDGFVMGEGSAILVLEEWERAKARGAKIYAEIKGFGSTADAYHITQPSPEGQGAIRAIELALKDAQVSKEDVHYINAHGTSTLQNDKIETYAIKKVFQDQAYHIPVSSTKSMLGHLLGAAGAIEALVTTMSIFKQQIHSTANYENPDPECDLDYVAKNAREIKLGCALSNSFGFGGHNVCLVFCDIEKK